MNQNLRVLFVVSPASQERLQLAAGSDVAFANSFTPQLLSHPWQTILIEDALWSETEVLPYREKGISILALTNAAFASAEVFVFRRKGAKKLYGIGTDAEVAHIHSEVAIELRRLNRTGAFVVIPSTKASAGVMVGKSPTILLLADQMFSVSRTDMSILILGETGAGKEIVAKTLHSLSERSGKLVSVNCSALPADLAESLLFGHEKGAFSGAATRQPGFFEQAEGGTLFLDEVFELPEAIQAKLLRSLQEGTVVPLGGKEKKVDVRIVGATNRSPEEMMAAGGLRSDFYYRFAKTIEVPPLRNRVADIPVLIGHFLSQAEHPLKVGEDIVALLQSYSWPGNVRELKALVDDWVSRLRIGEAVIIEDLPVAFHPSKQPSIPEFEDIQQLTFQFNGKFNLDTATHLLIRHVVALHRGNYTHAANELGITRNRLRRLLDPKSSVAA